MLSRKWLKSYRKFDKFYTMNSGWLNTIFEIPLLIPQTLVSNSASTGHPVKTFTKRIKEFSNEVKTLLLIENDENDSLNQSFSDIDLNI